MAEPEKTQEELAQKPATAQPPWEQERQTLLKTMAAAQREERRRIARDLHDGLCQSLTALSLRLCLLDNAASLQAVKEAVADLREITYAALTEARRMAKGLDPSVPLEEVAHGEDSSPHCG